MTFKVRRGEGEGPSDLVPASEAGLALAGDGLDPAEALFDPLADSLAHAIAGMAGGAPIDDEASVNEIALNELENQWGKESSRFDLIPGKEALSFLNKESQERYGVSVTVTGIIEAMLVEEISGEMRGLVNMLSEFASFSTRHSS